VFMQHVLAKPQALTIVAGVPVGQSGGLAAMSCNCLPFIVANVAILTTAASI
jgi:hypothetical protein